MINLKYTIFDVLVEKYCTECGSPNKYYTGKWGYSAFTGKLKKSWECSNVECPRCPEYTKEKEQNGSK